MNYSSIYGASGIGYQVARNENNAITSITPSGYSASGAVVSSAVNNVSWSFPASGPITNITYTTNVISPTEAQGKVSLNTMVSVVGSSGVSTFGKHINAVVSAILQQSSTNSTPNPTAYLTNEAALASSISTSIASELSSKLVSSTIVSDLLSTGDIYPDSATSFGYMATSSMNATSLKCLATITINYAKYGASKFITIKSIPLQIRILKA